MLRNNSRGDTIVEVLIAIAIASAVLGGALVSANSSTKTTRAAQERGEALQLLQGQVESLKALAAANRGNIFSTSAPSNLLCVKSDASDTIFLSGSLPAVDATLVDAFYTNGSNNCIQQPYGGIKYYFAIERDLPNHLFTFHVRWNSVKGVGNDEVTYAYRLFSS